jgi:DNA modification methylase
MNCDLGDIHPRTPVNSLVRKYSRKQLIEVFPIDIVASVTGMSVPFIRRAVGNKSSEVKLSDVIQLLELDSFAETYIPRSMIPKFLLSSRHESAQNLITITDAPQLILGSAKDLIRQTPLGGIRCVVTSTPYWGTRLYDEYFSVEWADGEFCPLGYEQTPEGFIRHTVELLYLLKDCIAENGSIWWNLMDTFNTRTQIRYSASETLKAMNGQDKRSWKEYVKRRYSAGHSFLEDGEPCLIPFRVAERASRIGYWVKGVITWKKDGSMPEPVTSRVTREAEYIIHLALRRNPLFNKSAYRQLSKNLGGPNDKLEGKKITDVWCLPTSSGGLDHGAQFPLALPGRCIALSTDKGDCVLDPFVGTGTTCIAASLLGRRSIGFEVSRNYLAVAEKRVRELK